MGHHVLLLPVRVIASTDYFVATPEPMADVLALPNIKN